ncbi:MAG: hypothetical protein R2683_01715 [Bifidobacterium adolescentis]
MTASESCRQVGSESLVRQGVSPSDRRICGAGCACSDSRHFLWNAEEPAIVSFAVVASVAMIALLAVFNPFRDGVAGHAISVIAGLLSGIIATTMMLRTCDFPCRFG